MYSPKTFAAAGRIAIFSLLSGLAARAATLPVPCIGGSCAGVAGFVTAGAASAVLSGAKMTVTQSTASATLNWQSFNISKDGTVQFVQPSTTAVALNRIWDSNPSQIFGALNANGRVFLINQNGIIFGAGAQVNVGGLVLSSLDINPLAQTGLLNAGEADQPAFQAGDVSQAAFQAFQGNGKASGNISIDQGATLTTSSGGQILVFAPVITNEGTIQTPGGQTMLAAGNTIYLASSSDPTLRGLLVEIGGAGGTVTNGDSADASVTNPAQLVGQILAKDGNVTLAGLAVNQDGLVSATTSINENGSIYLEAADQAAAPAGSPEGITLSAELTGGTLVLGPNSDTEVTLDTSDPSTTVDSVAQPKSDIEMSGKTIDMLSDSVALATSGTIEITAQQQGLAPPTQTSQPLTNESDDSSFYLAPGAELNVAGASIVLPVSSNVIPVQLESAELADSSEQQNGPLQGQTIYVDAQLSGTNADGTTWWGTPLADVSSDIEALEHNVVERNLAGGTITIHSQGDVILSPSSTVDVAGGEIQYTGGYLDTTELLTTGGQIVNIGSASPDVQYEGIVSDTTVADPKWGTSSTYQVIPGTYQPGYVVGEDAGTLNLSAPAFVFDAHLDASTVTGQYQVEPDVNLSLVTNPDPDDLYRPQDEVPLPATLNIGGAGEVGDLVVGNITVESEEVLPTLVNADGSAFDPQTDPLPASYTASILDPDLIGPDAFGNVSLETDGTYLQPAGIALDLPAGGSFAVKASDVDIGGSIDAPGGTISAAAMSTVTDNSDVSLTLGPTASLIASGEWVNANAVLYPSGNTAPLYISGGSVSLTASITSPLVAPTAAPTMDLAPGSVIDVSAGAYMSPSGELTAGTGGSITIDAETTPGNLAGEPPQLTLGSTLRGYALFDGGTLSISASSICIASSDCSGGDPAVLWMSPAALASGGFSSYQLTAEQGALTVAPGTTVTLLQQNLNLPSNYATLPDAASLIGIATPSVLPEWVRQPVDLSLTLDFPPTLANPVPGVQAALALTPQYPSFPALLIGSGAVISSDPGASLTLSSNTSLIDEGTLRAPGGNIALNLVAEGEYNVQTQYIPSQAIWLGDGAVLDASGAPVTYTNADGLTAGQVLDGGTVSLTAQRGYIELLPGSDIDVAGSSGTLYVTPPGEQPQLEQVASAGGTIDLLAAEGMSLGGSFQASAGTPGPGVRQPAGGTLSITLDPSERNDFGDISDVSQTFPTDPRQILVSQSLTPTIVAPGTAVPDSLAGEAFVPANLLEQSGFDIVSLGARRMPTFSAGSSSQVFNPGAIEFEGDVSLTAQQEISLDAGTYSVSPGATAQISAPYVEFGNSDTYSGDPIPAATSGTGTLEVSGNFIELYGSSALEGVGTASFDSSGDLRLLGVQGYNTGPASASAAISGGLYADGTINLDAAQIYPTTLSQFVISADPASVTNPTVGSIPTIGSIATTGSINVSGTEGSDQDLLSAGGSLTLSAGTVTQNGVLRAPFGTIAIDGESITLGAGSVTSTSANGETIPFGETEGGLEWVYTLQGGITTLYGTDGTPPPSQLVQLQGANVDVQSGATVDIAGGGDLEAYEWVEGPPSGLTDVLSNPDEFAILPALEAEVAPYDPVESLDSPLQIGESIHLDAGSGVPAGTYILLPARYALLPGAYLVTPVSGYQDIAAGQSYAAPDEGTIVAGYLTVSGLSVGNSINSAFDVTPNSIVEQESQYTLTSGNAFFAAQASPGTAAPLLPEDSGVLQLAASNTLTLDGSLLTTPGTGGLGAAVDISSANIVVGGSGGATAQPGVLELSSASLDQLGAQSLLIGGTQSDGSIDTTAQTVTIAGGADLTTPQVLLTAQDEITVAAGASISPTGSAPSGGSYSLSGDGAFLSVSAGPQVDVARSDVTGSTGVLSLASGSSLSADQGSIYLDATQDVSTEGSIAIVGGDLGVQAPEIALGNAPDTVASNVTVLGQNVLGAGGLRNLLLDSGSTLDFYSGASATAQDISLEATGLNGYGAAGDTATLSASGTLSLSNPQGATPSAAGSGTGSLALTAGDVTVDGGTLPITGFGSVSLGAQNAVTGTADGALTTTGSLTVSASRITTDSAVSLDLSAGGAVALLAPSSPSTLPAATGLGGSFSVSGSSIEVGTQIDLPSGEVSLETNGPSSAASLTVDSTGSIDVAGVVEDFDGVDEASPGGSVTLASAENVSLASGSAIDVSAGSGGVGGSLSISAPGGIVTASGTLEGTGASGEGASFSIDAESFDFQALNQTVGAGGFSGSQSFRLRGTAGGDNDLVVQTGSAVTAQTVSLEADQGSIEVDAGGLINASASDGGSVTLAAANDITVYGEIDAHATSAGGTGGTVDLDLENPNGQLILGSHPTSGNPTINVSGGGPGANGAGAGGTVLLRVPQATVEALTSGGTGVVLDGAVDGASSTVLEAYEQYLLTGSTASITQTDPTSPWYTNAEAFMNTYSAAAVQALGQASNSAFTLEPGIEIDATGDLELDSAWNLYDWRFTSSSGVPNSAPGILTLRAQGNITFNASLSDGFAATSGTGAFTLPTTPSNAWSYRIVAGADPNAANPLTVNDATPANVTIAACSSSCTPYQTDFAGQVYTPTMVRTGNGFIDVSASGDFVLGSQASMLYTAGVAGPGIDLSGFTEGSGDPKGRAYPTDGGNITIDVGQNVVGAQTDQFVNAWLWRLGATTTNPSDSATAWTVDFQSFQQGVAALGGGNVSVRAGGDITDLSVSIPSIGVQVGGTTEATSVVDVEGGGNLSVSAGGSILGGSYYVGLGAADLTAADDVGSVPVSEGGTGLSPIIGLGDATVDVTAGVNAELSAILNPTLLNLGAFQKPEQGGTTYFSTYGADSSVSLTAVGGDVTLNNDVGLENSTVSDSFAGADIQGGPSGESDLQGVDVALDIAPPSLNVYALGGSIDLGRDLLLWPSAAGSLQLLADQSIVATTAATDLVLSDADPALLPSPASPQSGNVVMPTFVDLAQALTAPSTEADPDLYAAVPVHESDDETGLDPVQIVALNGDVSFPAATTSPLSGIWSAGPAEIVAGGDILNLDLVAENLSPSDVTSVTAGGNITYPLSFSPYGGLVTDTNQIAVDGPGQLQITAGGSIDLGTSGGVVTRANLFDPYLPSQGASISMEAGIAGSAPQYAAFISQYIDGSSEFDGELTAFVEDVTGESDLTAAQAQQAFDAMSSQLQRTFVEQVFIDLLRTYGSEEAASGNGDYAGAFQALETLFPGAGATLASGQNPYSGDISLYFSQVYTEQGGNISLFTPGGDINVGLAVPPTGFGLDKQPDQLGIVAQTTGSVYAFANDGFEVNQSRVFAADGGDILVWTTYGDIDAGQGAKTSISAPGLSIVYDLNGQPTVSLRAPITGSGIQALSATPGVTPGHVYLFAPNGVVNANEAGIVAGSLTVAATAVLGTNNISVSGTTVGVPVAVTGLGASFSGAASTAAGATNTAVSSAAQGASERPSAPLANAALDFLQVFITGLGEQNCAPSDTACLQRESQQQNPMPPGSTGQ